jgi:hypothetical protein
MKRGLMNNIVNLRRRVKTIIFPGKSVGGEESIKLKLENTKAATIIAEIIINKPINERVIEKNKIPSINGMNEKINPNINEPNILPNKIAFKETGQVINLSKVFRIVSHGKTNGPMEVDVRKSTIAISPEIK